MPINLVQSLCVEVDSTKLLEQYLKLAIPTTLSSHEEIAVKIVNRNVKEIDFYLPSSVSDQTKHFPIILISGWFKSESAEGRPYAHFDGYGPWMAFRDVEATTATDLAISYILQIIKDNGKTWGAEFKKKFGDGYNNGFNELDGSVGFGFELRDCRCFPERLAISIVHIYYGK